MTTIASLASASVVLLDGTSRSVALLPAWAMPLHNADKVVLDPGGTAHDERSRCWLKPAMAPAGVSTLVVAMVGHRLCPNCRPAVTQ